MSNRLYNKTALVTGAGQGIGLAIAKQYQQEGARVIVTDLNEAALQQVAAQLDCQTWALDVGDAGAIAKAAERFIEVDVLVNCAGVVSNGTILDCSADDWERSMNLNVGSMFRTIQAFLPAMLERASGSIVNIASIVSSLNGAANRCAYGSSKAAVIGLTKSVAIDFIDRGIRCNAICPGTVESPSLQQRMADTGDAVAAREAFVARQPMGRLGTPEEIAAAAVMLAADDTAFMTGTHLVIDGGWSI